MNSLYNIFDNEKNRFSSREPSRRLVIMYSEAAKTIQYRDVPKNVLTVKFETETNSERFFYRPSDMVVTKEMKQKNPEATFGIYVRILKNKGLVPEKQPEICYKEKKYSYKEFTQAVISEPLRDIIDMYQYNRTTIGVDEEKLSEKNKTMRINAEKALKQRRAQKEME